MRYVLGAGIAGLMWAYYHPEYTVVSDRVGWGVVGADPLLLLHDAPSTRRLVRDLMGVEAPVVEKPIGYIVGEEGYIPEVVDSRQLTGAALGVLLLKKMIPWNVRRMADEARVQIAVNTPSQKIAGTTESIRYLDVDSRDVVGALLTAVRKQNLMFVGQQVSRIDERDFTLADGRWFEYDHLVSTLPAPMFRKLWQRRGPYDWNPSLNYLPVSFVVSRGRPPWLTDEWCVVYDARSSSPVSRIGLTGGRVQYEVTGRLDPDDPAARFWLRGLDPDTAGVFTLPYGRIVQDVERLTEPTVRVTFLGRFAQWRYDVLANNVLDFTHEWNDGDVMALNKLEQVTSEIERILR